MKIGKIVSVEFDKFRVKLLDSSKNSTISIDGQIYFFGNIGSYVKAENINGDNIICEVISILDNSLEDKNLNKFNIDHSREIYIKPIGTLNKYNSFNLGVGIFPSIFSDVSIVTKNDLDSILQAVTVKDSIKKEFEVHKHFYIGKSKNLIDYSVKINIDNFFSIHTAVLGNSGSGKSNTIAHIFQEVLRKSNYYAYGSKVILFDVNGEYKNAFKTKIDNENIDIKFYKPNSDVDKFILPYYLMNLDEWCAFLMASDRTQKPFWDRVLQECYKFYKIIEKGKEEEYTNYLKWKFKSIFLNILTQGESDTVKITSAKGIIIKCKELISNNDELIKILEDINEKCTISYGVQDGELLNYLKNIEIDYDLAISTSERKLLSGEFFDYNFLKTAVDIVLLEEEGKGNSRIREFTSTMLSRLDYFLYNSDCEFMRDSIEGININSKEIYLEKILGINREETFIQDHVDVNSIQREKQLIIIDSSEVGKDILELMTSVISRMLFDHRKGMIGNSRRKNPIHLILDEAHRYIQKNTDYIIKENIFEKIAREGRKYSLFLIISSQRPSELSDTVLSQCGNYIIHRIQNEIDMKYIYSVLPYFSPEYINKIKQSTPGEALIFGNCVPMPLQVQVQRANPEPNSGNCRISDEWYVDNNSDK